MRGRILVTGATGFIGARTLTTLLEQGFEVHAVGRTRPANGPRGITWHTGDLLDPAARVAAVEAARATHLLHLAWYAVPGRFWTAPENGRWVGATVELLNAFATAGGRRAVLAGSCAEYDWSLAGDLREDTTPLRPATFYGTCKDATRRVGAPLAAELGLSLAWGRVFFLYGPREHPERLVSGVARSLLAGERAAVTEGRQVRDFLHVDDVARAFAAIVASDVEGAVNVASGEGAEVRDVFTQLGRAAGAEDRLDIGARPTRPGEPPRIVADVTRLRERVGYVPTIGLEDGLAQTLAWWRDQ